MGKSGLRPWRAETMVEMRVRKADGEQPVGEWGPQEGAEVESELECFAMKSSADPTGHFGGEISLVKRPDLYLHSRYFHIGPKMWCDLEGRASPWERQLRAGSQQPNFPVCWGNETFSSGLWGGSGEVHTIFFDEMGNFHFNFFFFHKSFSSVSVMLTFWNICSFGVVRKVQRHLHKSHLCTNILCLVVFMLGE